MDYMQFAKENFLNDRFAIDTTGIEYVDVGEHYCKCKLVIEDKHLNNHDTVMGGAIFTLADFAFGTAANTPELNCVSLNASISFMRATTSPVLYAEAKCIKNGRSICFFNVEVTDNEGKSVATVAIDGYRDKEA